MITIFFYTAILASVAGLIIATYTDLKARIVPNKLNYGLAIVGLIIFGIQSITQNTYYPIVYSFLGMCLGFFFGWIMWKLGVFAGGDVKLFMGLGALNPFTPLLIKAWGLTSANIPIFPITLFIYALICFLPYGLFVMIYRLSKNKKMQKEIYAEMKPKIILAVHAALFGAAVYVILESFKFPTWPTIIILIFWGLFKQSKKYTTLVVLIVAAVLNSIILAQTIIAAMIFSVLAYTILKLMLSTRKVLTTEIEVKKLEEGMIPAKSLIFEGKKVVELEPINYKLIIKHIRERNLGAIKLMFAPKDEIISARKARGFIEEEIKEVKKLSAKGLIPKKILIKESMPFVPTMLLGYILCLAIGDLVFLVIFGVF